MSVCCQAKGFNFRKILQHPFIQYTHHLRSQTYLAYFTAIPADKKAQVSKQISFQFYSPAFVYTQMHQSSSLE